MYSVLILKDEGVTDYRDGYGRQRDAAKKLIDPANAGFDAVSKWYWTGDRVDLLKKLGVTAKSKNESKDAMRKLRMIVNY